MKKIGIMGGTFNPIHVGHLLLAEWAKETENLDEIWLIPTGCSYMKSDIQVLDAKERFNMTALAAEDNGYMRCLDIEVKRTGYTYTYETLQELKEQYPDAIFYFIFGADCLYSIENWKCPEKIFENCNIIAAIRGDASIKDMELKKKELEVRYNAKITLMNFLSIEMSSTNIRERVRMGQSIRYMVPDSVLSYIEEKGFYKDENN